MDLRAGSEDHPDVASWHALVDGEAGPARTLLLARHLEGCSRCGRVRDRVASLAEGLSALPVPEEPAGFAAQVMGRVRTLPAPRRRARALQLVAPAALVFSIAIGLAALPLTGRALRGFGRLLRPDLLEPSRFLDLLVGIAAAAAGLLGRAVEELVLKTPSMPALHGPEAPAALLMLVAMVVVGIAASTMVMLAVAGHGILRHCAAKAR